MCLGPWCPFCLHTARTGSSVLPGLGLGLVKLLARRVAGEKQDDKGLKTGLGTGIFLLSHLVAHKQGTRPVNVKGKKKGPTPGHEQQLGEQRERIRGGRPFVGRGHLL